jgi:hypothetical protein
MNSAARSFTDAPGLANSHLPKMSQPVASLGPLSRTSGVLPIRASVSDVTCMPARWQAGLATHLSTSLTFEIAEPIAALAAEHDGAADLILLSEPMPYPASPLAAALARIGGTVLAGG